jgi:hypothetical protein
MRVDERWLDILVTSKRDGFGSSRGKRSRGLGRTYQTTILGSFSVGNNGTFSGGVNTFEDMEFFG